ncbi:MAG: AAA family ATPase [Pseudomonadota bacterium]
MTEQRPIKHSAAGARSDAALHHASGPTARSGRAFCETAEVRDLVDRGRQYLEAGVPIHFSGPAGIGKTALAMRIAKAIGRPVSLMTGHDGLSLEDFVGRQVGHRESVVVDTYIQSVRRKETQSSIDWRDAALADAMERGNTLIYDEFTRASPEANVALLSVLEEGLLVSSGGPTGRSYIRAHPSFRVILTSNPADYVAVNSAPDALLDRLVTFNLAGYSAATEGEIVKAATGLALPVAQRIVAIVRGLRPLGTPGLLPSMRTSLIIARIWADFIANDRTDDAALVQIVRDVVLGRAPDVDTARIDQVVFASRPSGGAGA